MKEEGVIFVLRQSRRVFPAKNNTQKQRGMKKLLDCRQLDREVADNA